MNEGNKRLIQNFHEENSWKATTWRSRG